MDRDKGGKKKKGKKKGKKVVIAILTPVATKLFKFCLHTIYSHIEERQEGQKGEKGKRPYS